MEYIGDANPAPKLKDADLDFAKFYKKTKEYMKTLYKSGMVYGDLSEFNILAHKGMPIFIDFSQATSMQDPNCEEWLVRDCRNIAKFFTRRGVKVDEGKLLKEIKGK